MFTNAVSYYKHCINISGRGVPNLREHNWIEPCSSDTGPMVVQEEGYEIVASLINFP